jgi:putative ABC transport system substrate-binding protein
MKKALIIIMALVISLAGLTACRTNRDSDKLRIGIIQFAPHPSLDNCRIGFINGLADLGYCEERVVFDYQNANADMNLSNVIAQKMASDGCDMIVAIATPAAQAAFNATVDLDIPVVFIAVSYPVHAGLVHSLENPINNITGVSDVLQVHEQIALVRQLLPEARTLGVLYNIGEINAVRQVDALRAAAEEASYTLEAASVTNVSEVPLALESLLNRVDVLINVLDNTVVSAMAIIADRCAERGIAIIGSEDEQVRNGALASNGFDYLDAGRQAAAIAARILEGEKASEIPVELVRDLKITINNQVVEALGITVPAEIADAAEFVN